MQKNLCKFVVAAVTLFSVSVVGAGEQAISASYDDSSLEWGACPAFFAEGCQIAVLHGDPSKPNADIYFKIPGGYEFPAHWHTSAERMVLVSGELDVKYEGQQTTHLKKGMYAYGPAKAVHDGKCVSKEECVLMIAFEEPVDAFEHE
jgi:quercetin dioxygenase-like cupin family protein